MKLIGVLTMVWLLLFSNVTSAQRKTFYHKNTFYRTFTNCEVPPNFGTDSSSLQKYMAEKLQNKIVKTEGEIKISVFIDTTGKASCEWIENNSNFNVKKEKLSLLIDSMPNWSFGIQNGHKVDCVELITMTFNKEDLEATYRIGTENNEQ